MEDSVRRELLKRSTPWLEAQDWRSLENLWMPYVVGADLDAQAYLGYLCLWCFDETAEKDQEMRGYLRSAANAGHADAVYWLASCTTPDDAERDELLKKAAALGSRGAQRSLGARYATGDWTGGPKDSSVAARWYRLAAERHHDDAQYNLGFMYILGEGLTADVSEGLAWLQRSAGQGNRGAMRLLADLYRNGHYGVPVKAGLADDWQAKYAATGPCTHFYLHDLEGSR